MDYIVQKLKYAHSQKAKNNQASIKWTGFMKHCMHVCIHVEWIRGFLGIKDSNSIANKLNQR